MSDINKKTSGKAVTASGKAVTASGKAVATSGKTTDLTTTQRQAIDSNYYVWVTASAGSGKTKVLIDRVLHLLLMGHRLRDILVITFTRAAAAEIKNRLNKKLAEWTFTPDNELLHDIRNILGDKLQDQEKTKKINLARGLFLQMMDEKQNLTIKTIHGFCQQLLNYFPLEAGVPFGFRLAEDVEAKKLLQNAIETTLLRTDGEVAPLLEEAKRCWQEARSLRQMIEKLLADGRNLRHQQKLGNDKLTVWQKKHDWLSVAAIDEKENMIADLYGDKKRKDFLTKKDLEPLKELSSDEKAMAIALQLTRLHDDINKAVSVKQSYVALALAIKILDHYEKIKFENGLLDYDDLITKAGDLLADENNIHPWVQYKMAASVKHLLLDEAQDTSPSQWRVVESLIDGFSALQKNRGERGFLVVGDVKQSIFGFQGANVAVYQQYKEKWQNTFAKDFRDLPFDISFRSGKDILQFIDKVFLGKDFGASHQAGHDDFPSQVVVKKFFSYEKENKEDKNKKASLQDYVNGVADDIRKEIAEGRIAVDGASRPVVASDIMVLIRKRATLQAPLVAALKKIGVAVAGRDRIALRDEWLVKDLFTLGQFALLPRVDFYLANLLVSPFCGLSYEELEKIAIGRDGTLYDSLAQHAKKNKDSWWQDLLAWLNDITAAVMQKNAFDFFYDILQRPCPHRYGDKNFAATARAVLLACWGREETETLNIFFDKLLLLEKNKLNHVAVALDNLLNDDSEIKKETANDQGAGVRIITCHGAKGLESPIVFLPDYIDRETNKSKDFFQEDESPPLFLSAKAKKQHDGWQSKKTMGDREEERLLYVALTRAKNKLVISGFGKNQDEKKKDGNDTPYKNSWYYSCYNAMGELQHQETDEAIIFGIGSGTEIGTEAMVADASPEKPSPARDMIAVQDSTDAASDNSWLMKKINLSYLNVDARLDEEKTRSHDEKTQPHDKKTRSHTAAAMPSANLQKGLATHRLLQVLSKIEKEKWHDVAPGVAKKILATEFSSLVLEEEKTLFEIEQVLHHPDNLPPDWQDVFRRPSDGKLFYEQEVMGVVDGVATIGRIDRMLVTAREVKILDYKTSAKKMETTINPSDVADNYKKQMAYYRTLLATTYPDKKIRTALLFTNGLQLVELE